MQAPKHLSRLALVLYEYLLSHLSNHKRVISMEALKVISPENLTEKINFRNSVGE